MTKCEVIFSLAHLARHRLHTSVP